MARENAASKYGARCRVTYIGQPLPKQEKMTYHAAASTAEMMRVYYLKSASSMLSFLADESFIFMLFYYIYGLLCLLIDFSATKFRAGRYIMISFQLLISFLDRLD